MAALTHIQGTTKAARVTHAASHQHTHTLIML